MRARQTIVALLLLPLTAFATSCSASTPGRHATIQPVLGADHDCVVPQGAEATVDWSRLKNPILSARSAGEKDQVMVWFKGRWHMIFSYVRDGASGAGGVVWDIATSSSVDMRSWTAPDPWPTQPGAIGVAAPEIAQEPSGRFVVTYQSDPGQTDGAQDRLYYRTTTNFESWSSPRPLAQSLAPTPGDRMIDGSLAWTPEGLILGYKAGVAGSQQAFEIAWSPSGSLTGPWRYIGKPDIVVNGDTIERDEFLNAGGTWHLMATSNVLDQPWLFTLTGNPDKVSGWLDWSGGQELQIPHAAWDSGQGISSVNYEWANASFLCNAVATDGYYYLLYAGSSEVSEFGGWGHAMIGIARSRNLVQWQVPSG